MNMSLRKKNRRFRLQQSHTRIANVEFVNPVREWLIGLACATGCFFAGIAYVVYDFYAQVQMEQSVVSGDVDKIVYPEDKVLQYAEKYTARRRIFEDLIQSGAPAPEVTDALAE